MALRTEGAGKEKAAVGGKVGFVWRKKTLHEAKDMVSIFIGS
ncbi:hypothetical protein [Acetomicrobium flavidum]